MLLTVNSERTLHHWASDHSGVCAALVRDVLGPSTDHEADPSALVHRRSKSKKGGDEDAGDDEDEE